MLFKKKIKKVSIGGGDPNEQLKQQQVEKLTVDFGCSFLNCADFFQSSKPGNKGNM